ncbi:MAG: PQQ-binding-like beta-propeller repeat protein [Verrucomicrobiota bacterium]
MKTEDAGATTAARHVRRRSWRARACAAAWWATLATRALQAADWPTYGGDYARSQVSPDPLPERPVESWKWTSEHPPQPAWQGEAKWDGWNKVYDLKPRQGFDRAFHAVIAGDRVYFGSSADDQVRCLDSATGKEQWTFYTEGPVRLAPTLHEGRAYFGSDDGCVYCVDARSGKEVWKARATPTDRRIPGNGRMISAWPVRTSVVVQDGVVYTTAGMFPAEGVHLVALDAKTGAEKWRRVQNDLPAQGYLLASKTRLYVPAGRNNPAVCDVQDGKRLRVVEGAGGTYALLTGDLLVFGPGKTGQLGAVEEGAGDQLATFQGNHIVVTAQRSYLHSDTEVTALDRARYLELARERRRLTTEQAALAKKLKQAGKKGAGDASPDDIKARLTELGRRIDEATTALDRCQLWKVPSAWPHSLLLAGDTLVLGGRNEVAGLRVADGSVAWRLPVDGIAHGLAAAQGALYVSTDKGAIHRLGAARSR